MDIWRVNIMKYRRTESTNPLGQFYELFTYDSKEEDPCPDAAQSPVRDDNEPSAQHP